MRYVAGFLRGLWALIVGDDWRVAAGVCIVLATGAIAVTAGFAGPWLAIVLLGLLVAVFAAAVLSTSRPDADHSSGDSEFGTGPGPR